MTKLKHNLYDHYENRKDSLVQTDFWEFTSNNVLAKCPNCSEWFKIMICQKWSRYILSDIRWIKCKCGCCFTPQADNILLKSV